MGPSMCTLWLVVQFPVPRSLGWGVWQLTLLLSPWGFKLLQLLQPFLQLLHRWPPHSVQWLVIHPINSCQTRMLLSMLGSACLQEPDMALPETNTGQMLTAITYSLVSITLKFWIVCKLTTLDIVSYPLSPSLVCLLHSQYILITLNISLGFVMHIKWIEHKLLIKTNKAIG